MPVIRSAVRSAINDTIRKAIASPWRYFLTFDPVLNSYAGFDTSVTLIGDFEIEIECVIPSAGGYFLADDTSISGYDRFGITSGGEFFGMIDSPLGGIFGTPFTPNNKLNLVKLTRTSGLLSVEVDGVSYASGLASTGNITFNSIAKPFAGPTGAPYFDGIISNVKLTDLTTSANSRIFPLNTLAGTENSTINTGSVTINNIPAGNRELFTFDEANNRWVGEELITQSIWENPASAGTQWSYTSSNNTWNYAGDGTLNTLILVPFADIPDIYLVEGQVERTAGSGQLALTSNGLAPGDTISDAEFNAENPYSYTERFVKSVDGAPQYKRRSGTLSVKLNKPSVKRIIEIA